MVNKNVTEKIFTNCFLVKTDEQDVPIEVCLAMKLRGFGEGLWNGSGGKPKDGETVEQATRREVEEEFRVEVIDIEKRAEIEFILTEEGRKVVMHTFLAKKWLGEPEKTDEMRPQWFLVKDVPYDQMWKGDKEWLPIILSGKMIKAKYTYSHEGGDVEKREIKEVKNLDNN